MRVPLDWLREYCDPALDVNGIEERLTMTGTKVEAIRHHGVDAVEHFVVGRVLSVEPHPDADRLRVCEVDLGAADDENPAHPAKIVCGAPNVATGQTVAVARPGAVMGDGTKIKRAKLRGVPSEGMILAENELELDSNPPTRGIMVLDDVPADIELAPGTPLSEVLPIAVEVLELEITPNRPDCLGVFGVARELHAATGASLAQPPWSEDPGSDGPLDGGEETGAGTPAAGGALAEVLVECPDLCPRFTARVFEDVTVAPSPLWLKARLMAAGQRPINNVVDITNYAMLLTGQPLHAFDLDHVAGARLTVRRAGEGEQVDTLDGDTRTLDAEMVVIADAEGPTSIAGVKGGARSEVRPETKRVLLEVATWNGPNIHRTSWSLGLRSEASARFEKGLAPEQCMYAQAVATRLLIECAGARVTPGTIDLGWDGAPPLVIRLREARVEAILGLPVSRERQTEILRALDFQAVQASDPATPERDGLDVTVPPLRRVDVTREVDLIEEVARIDGLEKLPATLPARRGAAGLLTHSQRVRRAAEDALVGRGLHEVIGWSFTDPGLLDRLRLPEDHVMRQVVRLENPMSETQSTMRPTLLGSLMDAARHNVSRNGPDVAIFESGAVYRAAHNGAEHNGALADEHHALGALLTGALGGGASKSWRGSEGPPTREVDFFAAKALLGAVLDKFHVDWTVQAASDWPFLHPGRSAAVLAGGERLGFVGEVHPLVAGQWDLERTAVFVIDLGKLAAASPPVVAFKHFASVPSLHQDLAVVLPQDLSAADVLVGVREAGGEMLDDVSVFDVYTGPQVGEGMRSLALALSFRASDRTLTDEDVAPARERIVAALGDLGGELRG
ncbi:MAG TPA: phenylalanine--tRNA ligase subunit beta [Solirubrobacteraceae bacterium]|nr:phenylalanine--tRNA ligase subunit beta [Solirubrobacteraceae bacterium]